MEIVFVHCVLFLKFYAKQHVLRSNHMGSDV